MHNTNHLQAALPDSRPILRAADGSVAARQVPCFCLNRNPRFGRVVIEKMAALPDSRPILRAADGSVAARQVPCYCLNRNPRFGWVVIEKMVG
ncbi:hypothetical protein CEXT_253471 [Caerostris extrusa]|uniref:Uncharacterized protein n=1 Tax=Caerostris extrusa TaxID=172846 RepID=A0AAV4N1N2_CAEEX|nr:hypothetical protein CEXT_253471 [Caerostris extrusa]